jgi:hypothetical protein
VGSCVGGLTSSYFHPYPHITSLTDHLIILYLTIFQVAGSRVQAITFHVLRYPFCTKRFAIYIMTVRPVAGTELLSIPFPLCPSLTNHSQHLANFISFATTSSRVPKLEDSQNLPNPNHYHPSPPPLRFSQYTFSMV